MSNFLLSDMLSTLKIGFMQKTKFVLIKNCIMHLKLLNIFYDLGYIFGFTIINKFYIKIYLKFYFGNSVIRQIFCISTPSRRFYFNFKSIFGSRLNNYSNSNSFLICSTSLGFLTDVESTIYKIGGEPLIFIC